MLYIVLISSMYIYLLFGDIKLMIIFQRSWIYIYGINRSYIYYIWIILSSRRYCKSSTFNKI